MVIKVRQILQRQSEVAIETSSIRSHEEFLKMIKACKSLIEAKKIRNQIIMEIRRRRLDLIDRLPTEIVNGMKVQEMIQYMNKLLIAKAEVEKRIQALGGPSYAPMNVGLSTQHVTLSQLLSSTSGLSHFMEFLDQKKKTNFLQFWLMAESFRKHVKQNLPFSALREDFGQMNAIFFSPLSSKCVNLPLNLSMQLDQIASELIEKDDASKLNTDMDVKSIASMSSNSPKQAGVSGELVAVTFQAVLDAQVYVFQRMEAHDFVEFVKSDLYLSLINDPAFTSERDSGHKIEEPDSDTCTINLSLLDEEAFLPSDAVEAVEEEIRTIFNDDSLDQSLEEFPSTLSHSREDSSSSTFSRFTNTSKAAPQFLPTKGYIRQELDKLSQQEAIVDTLLANACKENKNHDLIKVLEKSKSTLRDEMREFIWQDIQENRRESTVIVSVRVK
jgi:hypothetical protein